MKALRIAVFAPSTVVTVTACISGRVLLAREAGGTVVDRVAGLPAAEMDGREQLAAPSPLLELIGASVVGREVPRAAHDGDASPVA